MLKNKLHNALNLLYSIKSKNLHWRLENQEQQLKLSHDRKLAEKQLAAELTKRNVQLAHDINLLKTEQQAKLTMLKTRCKEDIKDYQEYLESLKQLKAAIQTSYKHLPDSFAFTIHHHAKTLLNQMWETEDLAEKLNLEVELIKFMTTAHEEAALFEGGRLNEKLPNNTLKLIHQRSEHSVL